jgi:hypothetical protein
MSETQILLFVAYSPVIIFAFILIIGTIIETLQHLYKND